MIDRWILRLNVTLRAASFLLSKAMKWERKTLFKQFSNCPVITLAELKDFAEDRQALARFWRPGRPGGLMITAFACLFAAGILIPILIGTSDVVSEICGDLTFLSLGLAFWIGYRTVRRVFQSIPLDEVSGLPMEIFRLQDIKNERTDLVYLARQSRTYFRVRWASND